MKKYSGKWREEEYSRKEIQKTFRKEREKFNGKWVSIQSEKRTFWERGVE